MDYGQFLKHLPARYDNWGQVSVHPRSARFQHILQHVRGMTSANLLQLLNAAVACLEPGEVDCEIGSFQRATLIGALLDNAPHVALAADNLSEFDPHG
jgi:protein O-GlcNAc transferase